MRRFALIVNSMAGSGRGLAAAEAATGELVRLGATVHVHHTKRRRHAVELASAAAAARDVDAVVALGGDGTLREVIEGCLGKSDRVGIIPVGTANVAARELGIPLGDPRAAARVLIDGEFRRWDIAKTGSRWMVANAGVGFEADIVRRIHVVRMFNAHRKRGGRMSMASYVCPSMREFLGHRSPSLTVTIDGRKIDGVFSSVVVSNCKNYGGVMSITPDADPGDGRLDICLRKGGGKTRLMAGTLPAFLGQKEPTSRAIYLNGRSIEVHSNVRSAVQVDGDANRFTPLLVEVSPEPILILAPSRGRSRT